VLFGNVKALGGILATRFQLDGMMTHNYAFSQVTLWAVLVQFQSQDVAYNTCTPIFIQVDNVKDELQEQLKKLEKGEVCILVAPHLTPIVCIFHRNHLRTLFWCSLSYQL